MVCLLCLSTINHFNFTIFSSNIYPALVLSLYVRMESLSVVCLSYVCKGVCNAFWIMKQMKTAKNSENGKKGENSFSQAAFFSCCAHPGWLVKYALEHFIVTKGALWLWNFLLVWQPGVKDSHGAWTRDGPWPDPSILLTSSK